MEQIVKIYLMGGKMLILDVLENVKPLFVLVTHILLLAFVYC